MLQQITEEVHVACVGVLVGEGGGHDSYSIVQGGILYSGHCFIMLVPKIGRNTSCIK